jgi:Domain of unknown function (DUF6438)
MGWAAREGVDPDEFDPFRQVPTDITSVTLSRGMCYGECPVYEVTLRANGSASWKGVLSTSRLGRYKARLDPWEFCGLARFIERCGFFDWNDAYVMHVTDFPQYELTVRRGRRRKKVRQYATDEPPDFWVIARLVDAIADGLEWSADK